MKRIKEDIIEQNLQKILKTNSVMVVLKDNAYGFGIPLVVDISKKLGITDYAVKSIEEGIEVRKLHFTANILILGKIRTRDVLVIKKYTLLPTINDYDDYLLFKENKIPCHLAIDTGMNRFGMKNGYLAIINDPIVKAIYTHCYQDKHEQKIRYLEQVAKDYLKPLHIGGSIAYQKTKSMLRVGRIIYEKALEFYGHIVNIKYLNKGETVGYDGYYTAQNSTKIGICDIGYCDGLNLFFHGSVHIKKGYYSVVGRCCMDQCFILIDDMVEIGDEVEFFGQAITEDEFIRQNSMTIYEMFLQINHQGLTK